MYDFIFNEEQEKEKKKLSVRGFTEIYSQMIYAVLSDRFEPCESEPQLVIAEKDELTQEKSCPVIIIGSPAEKKKNRKYVSRPVDLGELRKIAFALTEKADSATDLKTVLIDEEEHSVSYGGNTAILTKLEFQLFLMLKNAELPLSREDIRKVLWQNTEKTNISDVYVCYLRKKLAPLFGDGFLTSVRGKGYIMRLP